MKKIRKQFFNLVEIALAIAILAIGVTSVLTLFPVGFDRTKHSIADNYCSESANSLFAHIARVARDKGWNIIENLPTERPTDSSLDNDIKLGDWSNEAEGNIYTDVSDKDGIYGIKVKTGDYVDFSGIVYIWKTAVGKVRVGNDTVEFGTASNNDTCVAINVKIDWPAQKPASARNTNRYYFELFDYNAN